MPPELEFPVYPEIDKALSWYGFERDDFAVLLLIGWCSEMVFSQARISIGRFELTLILTVAATVFPFMLWRGWKAGKPRHLLEDALQLLAEPEVWEITPDADIRPAYIIERSGRWSVEPPQTARIQPSPE